MPANAAVNMHGLNTKNENIMAICSGNGEIRWINLKSFYQTGQLTFIDPPSVNNDNESNNSINNACSICSVINYYDHNAIILTTHFIAVDAITSEASFSVIQHFTKRSSLGPSSRGPPSLT